MPPRFRQHSIRRAGADASVLSVFSLRLFISTRNTDVFIECGKVWSEYITSIWNGRQVVTWTCCAWQGTSCNLLLNVQILFRYNEQNNAITMCSAFMLYFLSLSIIFYWSISSSELMWFCVAYVLYLIQLRAWQQCKKLVMHSSKHNQWSSQMHEWLMEER